jgi:AAA+ superfamily predicted ATPase
VYLFDEFDALGGERGMGNDVGEARRMLNSLLLFLEDVPSDSLLLAATNHPQLLDQALFRRFDLTCGYMLPTPEDSVTVLRSALQKMGTDSIDWGGLGDETAGLSHAELVKAAEDAAKAALLAGSTMVEEHSLRAALRHRRGVAGAAQLSP